MNDLPPRPPEYVYLGSPYSHPDPDIREERFLAAEKCSVWMLGRLNWNYSPIVYCHRLAKVYHLPTHAEYWKEYNRAMLLFSRAFYILTLDGWKDSVGLKGELSFAKQEGILVRYIRDQAGEYIIGASP